MANSRKHLGYLAVILLLMVVLTGKHLRSRDASGDTKSEVVGNHSEYTLYADRPAAISPTRDIFYGGGVSSSSSYQRSERAADASRYKHRDGVKLQESPPVEQVPSEATAPVASGEMGGIKLLGVVENGKRLQAFLALGTQREIVDVGQMLQGRYKVVDIKITHVSIVDLNDNTQRIIPVSGR